MPIPLSSDVQHGLNSWIDWDRPWILRMFVDNLQYIGTRLIEK